MYYTYIYICIPIYMHIYIYTYIHRFIEHMRINAYMLFMYRADTNILTHIQVFILVVNRWKDYTPIIAAFRLQLADFVCV